MNKITTPFIMSLVLPVAIAQLYVVDAYMTNDEVTIKNTPPMKKQIFRYIVCFAVPDSTINVVPLATEKG